MTSSPSSCVALVIGAMVLQSSQNCIGSRSKHFFTSWCRWVLLCRNEFVNLYNANLVEVREGQNSGKDSTVALREAGVSQHSVKVHNTLVFQGTQWPVRNSSLNLSDRSLAWVVAFSTHHGLALQDLNMVWQAVRPRNSVLSYFREESAAAWDLNF